MIHIIYIIDCNKVFNRILFSSYQLNNVTMDKARKMIGTPYMILTGNNPPSLSTPGSNRGTKLVPPRACKASQRVGIAKY